jgi:hypothetical protein
MPKTLETSEAALARLERKSESLFRAWKQRLSRQALLIGRSTGSVQELCRNSEIIDKIQKI